MPEMHFRVRWPHGLVQDCYSPSYVIEEHLAAGESYPVPAFVERVRAALEIASERVRARYGFACSSALEQLRALWQGWKIVVRVVDEPLPPGVDTLGDLERVDALVRAENVAR